MKKLLPILTLALASVTSVTYAQTDTTKLDLGRITVQKQFTQSVTVKGVDLQKLPFTTLSDAVNTWFYGVYGTASYATVIDGNMLADINAYSVYDIEEVTLVQNAVTHLNGVSPSQILLLVKTKRSGRPGRSGIDVNGQINYINLRNVSGTGKATTGNMYHQYYVSPYVNKENLRAGLSATFQRTVVPALETNTLKVERPMSYTVKLNGYLDLKLSKDVLLSVNSGYVPQTDTLASSNVNSSSTLRNGQHANHYLWYGDVKLHTNITSQLTNHISAGMQIYDRFYDLNTHSAGGSVSSDFETHASYKRKNFLIKDDLSYKLQADRWLIEPNLNFTYREYRYRNDLTSRGASIINYTNPPSVSVTEQTYSIESKIYAAFLTPSISFSLDKAFMLQGGFQYLLRSKATDTYFIDTDTDLKNKMFPFVSLTANILRSDLSEHPNTDLTVYGSFAKGMTNMSDPIGMLTDGSFVAPSNYIEANTPGGYIYVNTEYDRFRSFDQLQAGATLSLLKNKVNISYNYNVRKNFVPYTIAYYTSPSSYFSYNVYPNQRVDLHRLGIDWQVIRSGAFNWTTGLNGSVAKSDVRLNTAIGSDPAYYYLNTAVGNVTSGGFINRVTYRKLSVGLDVLYRINEDQYLSGSYPVSKGNVNSFDLKNLYVAYQLSPKWAKSTQLFANARNLIQNKQSTVTDNRRYYGFGFMVSL